MGTVFSVMKYDLQCRTSGVAYERPASRISLTVSDALTPMEKSGRKAQRRTVQLAKEPDVEHAESAWDCLGRPLGENEDGGGEWDDCGGGDMGGGCDEGGDGEDAFLTMQNGGQQHRANGKERDGSYMTTAIRTWR